MERWGNCLWARQPFAPTPVSADVNPCCSASLSLVTWLINEEVTFVLCRA
jgi:hypothetical protein